ncbi:MAG TPA: hypothetical protein PK040_01830 [Anaerolineaceae bacterium]|nr:hypothetical protein [Anaerolineaceae bacterium]
MKKALYILIIIALLITGCQSSSEKIAVIIGLTQTAIEKLLPTATPTPTSFPTATNTPTNTETPEPSLTPTADKRVIEGDPSDFLIKLADLPKEYQYFLPYNDATGRTSNDELIIGWGNDKEGAKKFLEETGRLDSWYVNYVRQADLRHEPVWIGCSVGKHSSSQGVIRYIEEYNYVKKPFRDEETWKLDKTGFTEYGEHSIGITTEYYDSDGRYWHGYRIEVPYYNYYVACWGYGKKFDEVTPEFLINIVKIITNKLQDAKLVMP